MRCGIVLQMLPGGSSTARECRRDRPLSTAKYASAPELNAGFSILPDGGRSIVFIPPRSLDFRVRHLEWIACREGPVKRVSGNQCAQCGAVLIAPEWSEHFPDNRVRNVWSCEACGYEFEDTVYWSARELVEAE